MPKKKSLNLLATQEALPDKLLADLIGIIESRKQAMYRQVNSGVILTFWEVGKRINEEILGNERAEYGKQIIATASQQLQVRYGASFEYTNLTRMMKFAREFTDAKIIAILSQQLSWGHIKDILPIKDMDAKALLCRGSGETQTRCPRPSAFYIPQSIRAARHREYAIIKPIASAV